MKKTLTIASLLLVIVSPSLGQGEQPKAPPTQSQDDEQDQGPMNCEHLLALLDIAIIDWMDLKGSYFILIARLGKGERDRKLNLARLRYVEEYLRKKNVQYIFAEGSRVNGLGRVEVYVGGRLAFSAPTRKGVIRLCFGNTG